MIRKIIGFLFIKFLKNSSTSDLIRFKGEINSVLQGKIFNDIITIKIEGFLVEDDNKGPFIAILSYDLQKSTIKRFFIKPNLVIYSEDKKKINLKYQFRVSSKSILEARLNPGRLTYFIIISARRNCLKLKNISQKKAFELISSQIPFVSCYLERNPRLIPAIVKKIVWERDKGKCVVCNSSENLHFDHIIPYSKGGSPNETNIQLLCKKCNLRKSANIVNKIF